MSRARGAATLVLAAVVALGACAVREQGSAREVAAEDVPFGLLEPDGAPPATVPQGGEVVTLYLVSEGELVPVQRSVAEAEVDDVLEQLTMETLDVEADAGLRSVLDAGDGDLLISAELSGGRVTVDLANAFTELDRSEQLLAIAQVVLTLTGRPGVGQVVFTLEGAPIDVPRADGTTTGDPLTRGDYTELLTDDAG